MTGLHHSGRRHSRGFTLVELLIVVGVLAVLLSLLIPTMGRVREQAKRVQCLNNLRQLALAGIAYAGDDPDGYYILPTAGNEGDNFSLWHPKYVSDFRAFVCPSTANVVRDDPKINGVPRDLTLNAVGGAQDSSGGHSYELRNWYWTRITFPDGVRIENHSGLGNHVPKRIRGGPNVKSARIMLVTDGDDQVNGDQNNWPDRLPNGTTNDNHGAEGFNCSFLDGRAEWLPTGRAVLQTYMDGYYNPNIPDIIINQYGLYRSGDGYEWR
jgi:prepilin-type N-terminal cleavage/methylation domain-containing protein